jgi:sugar lactone lactonase YvrE
MLLGLQDGFWLTEIGDSRPRRLAAVEPDDPDTRLNDGKCDRAGRVWAGTMAHDARPRAGSLYRLEADGRVSRMFRAVSISNGIAWSPDNRTMYFIDSAAHGIDALDYNLETGTATRRRRIISIPSVLGLADGMTIDTDGYLWVAMYGGWVVHRYSPGGALDRVIRLPVSKVTSCIFGGDDLGDLYITSAASGLDEAALRLEPLAGGLFRCRPGPTGIAEVPFGG